MTSHRLPRRPVPRYRDLESLRRDLAQRGAAIRERLAHFRQLGAGDDETLFAELCFCLLAVQSSARRSDEAVRELKASGLLWSGDVRSLARCLRPWTRFHNHKAAYLVAARQRFFGPKGSSLRATLDRFPDARDARAWFAREIHGLGYKEASHFLRNIGRGEDLAILDRHVLRNLVRHGVLPRVPKSLGPQRYLAIEARARNLATCLGISLGVLDLLLWSRQTGEIFK